MIFEDQNGSFVHELLNNIQTNEQMNKIVYMIVYCLNRNKFRRGMIPLDSVEIFDGKSWKNLTSKLPRPIGSHCAVSIR